MNNRVKNDHLLVIFTVFLSTAMVLQSVSAQVIQSQSDEYFLPKEVRDLLPENHYGVFVADEELDHSFVNAADGWGASGFVGLNTNYVDIGGDQTRSPLSFDGDHSYIESDLQFSKDDQQGNRFSGSLGAIINDSQYRGVENGLILERGYLEWDRVAGKLPTRIRGGDFFAAFSPRIVQRPLKGLSAELQNLDSWFGTRHSLQSISSVNGSTYRDLSIDDGWFNGISSLWVGERGSLILNALHFEDALNNQKRSQRLTGIGLERKFTPSEEIEVTLESELANLREKREEDVRSGTGLFSALNAKLGQRVIISAQIEDYDESFNPVGGSIISNRRTREGRIRWSTNNVRTTLRAQEFIDRQHSENPLTTRIVGLNVSGGGNLGNQRINVFFDGFSRENFDHEGSTDRVSDSLNLELTLPFANKFVHRIRTVYLSQEDTAVDTTARGFEIGYNLGVHFTWGGWRGFTEGGLLFREVDNQQREFIQDAEEIGISLSVRMKKNNFTHEVFYRSLDQDRLQPQLEDFQQQSFGYRFQYRRKQHQLELNLRRFLNEPNPGLESDAQQFSLSYRYYFKRRSNGANNESNTIRTDTLLAQLQPGLDGESLGRLMIDNGLNSPIKIDGYQVFNVAVLDDINERQRLAIATDSAGSLLSSSIIIEFDTSGSLENRERQFERVRNRLIRILGAPADSIIEGEFDQINASNLASGRFVRNIEWQLSSGIVALTVPVRVDGQLRMEVTYAQNARLDNVILEAIR